MLFLLLLFSSDISCRRKKSYQKRSNDGISQKRTPVKEDVPNERFCFFLHCLRYNYKGVQLREEPRQNLFEDFWLSWFAYFPSQGFRGLCRKLQMPANLTSANQLASFTGRKSIQIKVFNKEN